MQPQDPAEPHAAGRPQRRKGLRWCIGALLALLILLLLVLLFKDSVATSLTQGRIRRETDLPLHLGNVHVAPGSFQIHELKLFNVPDFGGSMLLDMPELEAQLDVSQALRRQLHFKVVRVKIRQIHIVRNKAGRLNLERLRKPTPRSGSSASHSRARKPVFAGIETLFVTLDEVNYTDLKRPRNSRQITLGIREEPVTNVATKDEVEIWVKALLVRVLVQEYLNNPRFLKNQSLELIIDRLRN